MTSDAELLKSYVKDHSETCFAELVQRHINLVYATALREVNGDSAQAEDITQTVFCELAKKAFALCKHPALAGWCYTTVRQVAANIRRSQQRRIRRENTAFTMDEIHANESPEIVWSQVRPVIDDAMHELSDDDRTAVVLRYFEDRSLREIGETLGINENAARMRVDRAMEKLRCFLGKRGITSTASSLGAAISVGAILAAPSGLAASVASAAVTTTTFSLINIITMTYTKIALVGTLAIAAITVPIWQQTRITELQRENKELEAQASELIKQGKQSQKQPDAPNSEELLKLRASQAEMRAEILQLRGRLGAALREKALTETKALTPQQPDLNNSNTNTFVSGMADLMKNTINQQVDGKLARMKAKLNLTADQESAIKDILVQQAEKSSQAIQKVFAGKTSLKELRDAEQPLKNPEDQINVLLSPDQVAQYKTYKREEAMATARLSANAELIQMQTSLGLTQEQQDQVFGVLYDQSVKIYDASVNNEIPKKDDPVAVLEWQIDQKAKGLASILSPEQVEVYRKQQQAGVQFLRNMLPAENSANKDK